MTSASTRRSVLLGAAASAAAWPLRASFATAGGPRDSLRLAFVTDVHARTEWQTPVALELAAKAINATAADLVLVGGDLVTDGFDGTADELEPRWRTYLAFHAALRPRAAAALGNHDLLGVGGPAPQADPRAAFRSHVGVDRTYRALDTGGCHVVLLDPIVATGDELRYRGWVAEEQLAWLTADLTRVDRATPLVVMSHMPLLTGLYQATEGAAAPAPLNRVVENNRAVLDACRNHNLVLVLQGHLHVDELLRWRDTTFITGGALSGKWWRRGDWHGTGPGFGVVTLRHDRIDWEYRSYGWQPRRP